MQHCPQFRTNAAGWNYVMLDNIAIRIMGPDVNPGGREIDGYPVYVSRVHRDGPLKFAENARQIIIPLIPSSFLPVCGQVTYRLFQGWLSQSAGILQLLCQPSICNRPCGPRFRVASTPAFALYYVTNNNYTREPL
mgnify:FL=1